MHQVGLTAYEQQRAERIRLNEAKLAGLAEVCFRFSTSACAARACPNLFEFEWSAGEVLRVPNTAC